MDIKRNFTAIIQYEESAFVALCPELDIASQGKTIQEARNNLSEAIQLFFETASQNEIKTRLHSEVYISSMEVSIG